MAESTATAVSTNQPGPTGEMLKISFVGGRVSIQARNASLPSVLASLADKTGIPISSQGLMYEKISIQLQNVSIDEAIKQICSNRAIVYEFDPAKNAYRIVRVGSFGSTLANPLFIRPSNLKASLSEQGTTGVWQRGDPDILPPAFFMAPGSHPQRVSGEARDRKGRPLYRAGELLIKYGTGVKQSQLAALHREIGAVLIDTNARRRLHKVILKKEVGTSEAIAGYKSSALIENVERHALRYPNVSPNDPYLVNQWNVNHIDLPEAWNHSSGSADIVIAIIDTGINFFHPDLSDNMWVNVTEYYGQNGQDDDANGYVDDIFGYDFADNDWNPWDLDGHGTHVAGIVAARGNNSLGVAGTCWEAKIMALKAQPDNDNALGVWAIIEAIDYAIAMGAQIVNCSFGGDGTSQDERDAFLSLQAAGILVVCAAGNNGINLDTNGGVYPASHDLENMITVAAGDAADKLAVFSGGGSSNYGASIVDVMAPGIDIRSTISLNDYASAAVMAGVPHSARGLAFAGYTDAGGISATVHDCGLGGAGDCPPVVNGNIALIERGVLFFSEKVRNAQAAGAQAVVIYNNVPGNFNGTLGEIDDWIPAVAISQEDGDSLKLTLATQPDLITTVVHQVLDQSSFYAPWEGTSMAAPQVAGLAGLLWAANPCLNYEDLKAAIETGVDTVPLLVGKVASTGRINAKLAVLEALPKPGDLSFNGQVDLADAVLGMQIAGGLEPNLCMPQQIDQVDVNNDQRLGLPEMIYILQRTAGVREYP